LHQCWTLGTRATNSTLSLKEAKVVMKDYDKKFLSYVEYFDLLVL